VLCSGAGFGTLGVLGVVAGDEGLSIPTVLFFRFALATAFLGEPVSTVVVGGGMLVLLGVVLVPRR
jgi:uncharacterized membrane protein